MIAFEELTTTTPGGELIINAIKPVAMDDGVWYTVDEVDRQQARKLASITSAYSLFCCSSSSAVRWTGQ